MSRDVSVCFFNPFDKLPDDLLLNIFYHLSDFDLAVVRKVCKRFDSVSKDRELVRKVSFSGCYAASSTMVITYLRPVASHIEELDLNHCYWLSAVCCDTIARCRHLVALHLLHVRLSVARLVSMLGKLKHLQRLSVTLCNVREFQSLLDSSPQAQEAMRGLRVLRVQVKNRQVQAHQMTMQFLAVTSFFEYCSSLEEFHVEGSFCCKGIPPYVVNPQIRQLDNLRHIHTMTVTDAMDPFARMFFFGALLEVCKLPDLKFRCLLQPLVVNEHLARKDNFIAAIQRIEDLESLDISQTNDAIPNQVYQLERAHHLRYLNVADNSLVDCHSLQVLADNCPHLTSINLRDCHHLVYKRIEGGSHHVDVSGLQSLVMNCACLRHVNVSGVHIHAKDLINTGFSSLCHLLSLNAHWQSLSLSPCCLSARTKEGNSEHGRKRARPSPSAVPLSKKPRYGVPPLDLSVGEEEELSSELGVLVSACPNVQHFELIGAGFRSSFNKRYKSEDMRHYVACAAAQRVEEEDVLCIRRWKHLTYLQLSGVPAIHSGHGLAAITTGCVKLQRLFLSHLGPTPLGSYEDRLLTVLPSALCITDLRIEQSQFHLRDAFWHALGQMKSLQRLCVLSKNATFVSHMVERFVQKVPSLVVLQLFVGNTMTIKECSELQTTLMTRHKEHRPALSVCILPLLTHLHHSWKFIPDIHLDTLTIHASSVCLTPPPPIIPSPSTHHTHTHPPQ